MSTPGGYDPNAGSNPYGNDPYSSNPYGGVNPPPPPGGGPPGGNPYAAPGNGGGDAPLDGVSVGSLVTAVLCCTGPIGVILGIIGIVRTKAGQRRGRWMAVTGTVVGALATLSLAGIGIFFAWFANTVVTPDNAEAGQCVDLDTDSGDVFMTKAECGDEHDAQIYAVHELTESEVEAIDNRDIGQVAVCLEEAFTELPSPFDDKGRLTIEDYEVQIDGVANNPSSLEAGDVMICYVEAVDDKLEGDLLD